MNSQKQIDAMKLALEKFPELEPYYVQLRALCFPDVAGLDVREDFEEVTHQTGVPWTFQLMFQLKGVIPDQLTFRVPLFIIEVQKLMNRDTDYAQVFKDDHDIIFLEKQIDEYLTKNYYFVVQNKALTVVLKDYGDHLYIYVEGFHDDLELGGGEWPEEKAQRCRVTYAAWTSVTGGCSWSGGRADVTICRGNIKKDIEKAKATIAAVKPYISKDISLRAKAYNVRNKILNLMPELA